mmetsp:Transcript_6051/g.10756  ORF Transcript_6051/g.10756 Transcript_6051/m.10756 type:complete len:172 (+) Transcript_6051:2087-2602(+)
MEKLIGTWMLPSGEYLVTIDRCDSNSDSICGDVTWVRNLYADDGSLRTDKKNQSPALRRRPLLGMRVLSGFKMGDDGKHAHSGHIYNGRDGKTYNSKISLKHDDENLLQVAGCVLFICKSEVWKRKESDSNQNSVLTNVDNLTEFNISKVKIWDHLNSFKRKLISKLSIKT